MPVNNVGFFPPVATEIAVDLGGLSTTNDRPSQHGRLGRYWSLSFSNRHSVGLVHISFFSKPVRIELNRGPVDGTGPINDVYVTPFWMSVYFQKYVSPVRLRPSVPVPGFERRHSYFSVLSRVR